MRKAIDGQVTEGSGFSRVVRKVTRSLGELLGLFIAAILLLLPLLVAIYVVLLSNHSPSTALGILLALLEETIKPTLEIASVGTVGFVVLVLVASLYRKARGIRD